MPTTRALTALEVLSVAAGKRSVDELTDFLSIHAIENEPYEQECWQVVCDIQNNPDTPATVAAKYRKQIIESMPRRQADPVLCAHASALIQMLKTYAIKCTYESYADSYVSAMLKALLPPEATALVPRDLPPYSHAATYLGADCNETVRPILKTPLRSVLSSADWGPRDLRGFFAAAITLRELTGGLPLVFVNTELAAVTSSTSAVFALSRRIQHGGCGVVHRGTLIFHDTPINALYGWIELNKDTDAVSDVVAKLQ